jgi:hypothetical protein
MHYEKDSALQKTALTTFVEVNCHYFLSDECHGICCATMVESLRFFTNIERRCDARKDDAI